MENNKTIPKIRFTGFTDAWEQRRLGEVGKCQSGIGFPDCEQGGKVGVPFYKVSDMNNSGNEYEMVTANNYVSDEQIARKNWKPIDDVPAVIFAKVGAAIMLNRKRLCRFPFLLDNNTMAYKFDKSWDIDFGRTMFEKLDLTTLVQVGALPSYNASDVERMMIAVPKDLAEQYEIGVFFRTIDHLITLHQRKYDKTINIKNVMLEKIFPKDSENLPEIIFSKFAVTWEQRRLGEVANHRGGTAIEKHFDNSGKYKVISIGSYGLDSKYVDQNIRAISNEITDARVVRKGELTMVLNDKTSNGTIIGRSLLINTDDEYVINQRTEIISPKENLDSDFAYVVLNGPFREKVKRIVQGGTQIYVNYPAVENLEFELPSIEEQQKIGDFFIQLDHLITLHQRKCKI